MTKTQAFLLMLLGLLVLAGEGLGAEEGKDPGAARVAVVDDFQKPGGWISRPTGTVETGNGELVWSIPFEAKAPPVFCEKDISHLASGLAAYDFLRFQLKVQGDCEGLGVRIRGVLPSGAAATWQLPAKTEGDVWRDVSLPLKEPQPTQAPEPGEAPREAKLCLRAIAGLQGCTICVRDMRLVRSIISVQLLHRSKQVTEGLGLASEFEFIVKNLDSRPRVVKVSVAEEQLKAFSPTAAQNELELSAGASAVLVLGVVEREGARLAPLCVETIPVRFQVADEPEGGVQMLLEVHAPIPEIGRPSVMVTRDQIEAARSKVAESAWARERYEAFIESVKGWPNTPIVIPTRGGRAADLYFCKKCCVRLRPAPSGGHECPVCHTMYKAEPYDSVPIAQEHTRLAQGARDLGLAFALTDDVKYARKCAEILVGYAGQYRKYPLADGARVGGQPLDQARWAIPLAQAYDFIADSGVLRDEEKRRVERDLLRAAAADIERPTQSVDNIMCWRAAALGLIGFAIRDAELAQRAVEGPYGIRRQMVEGVGLDGVWFEGSWGYHLFALEALTGIAETASHFGLNLFTPHFEKMFLSPILAMEPDRGLPALNDTSVSRFEARWFYEVALAHYAGDPLLTWLLSTSPRPGIEPVLYGEADLPPQSPPASLTALFEDAGIAILRSGGGDPIYLALDYGPHGGWHGHYDKLGFVLFGRGREICPDPGSVFYTAPPQETWYRQTLSHNTVAVDQKSQAAGQGLLDFIHSTKHFQLVAASCDSVYPGVLFDRFVGIIGDKCVLIVDRLLGTGEHTYDWVLHCKGSLRTRARLLPLNTALGRSDGYNLLQNIARLDLKEGQLRTEFVSDGGVGLSVFMPLLENAEAFACKGLVNPPTESVPMAIARKKGYGAEFVALLEPWRGGSAIEAFEVGPAQTAGGKDATGYDIWFQIKGKGWAAQGIVSYNEEKKLAPSGLETDGRAGIVFTEEGFPPIATFVGGERLLLKGAPVEVEMPLPIMGQD